MPKVTASLGEAVRSAARVDRSKIALDVGVRVATGVALTLVVGRVAGHTVAGVTATIGALSAGMASHQGTYRSRAAVVVTAALVMGFCSFVGAAVGHLLGPDIAVTALVAFAAGMLVSLGPAGSVVGIQGVVGLVVFSQFSFPVSVAARDGGLVLLGGLVQVVLVVAGWPLRRFPAERRALGHAYACLSRFCREASESGPALLDPGALDGLDPLWRDPQPFGGEEVAAHRALASLADRLRLELVALMRARGRLAAAGAGPVVAALDEVLAGAGRVLDRIGMAVREGGVPLGWRDDQLLFRSARAALTTPTTDPGAESGRPDGWMGAAASEAERRVDALAGQLRAALRMAAVAAGAESASFDAALAGRPARRGAPAAITAWAHERVGTIRSNFSLSSEVFRHAARLAVTLAVAVAVGHALPWSHRYWVPMTAMLVLRPDFSSTVTRGISRVAGTLFGAGLVTVALAELRPGADWLIALVVVLSLPAAALVLANYAVYSVCIASLVVTLLAFTGNPELATAGDRSIYTLVGSALALVAYALWPTWEATSLPDTLAGLATTEGLYAERVLGAWADPAGADRAALQRARLDARLARSNAEAAVSRWLAEPSAGAGIGRETVLGYMTAVRSCVEALVTLHAELPEGGPNHPEAAVLAGEVERAFRAVADSVKGSPSAAALPRLRKEQLALSAGLQPGPGRSTDDGAAVVLAGETDLLVDSIDTLGHLLGLATG